MWGSLKTWLAQAFELLDVTHDETFLLRHTPTLKLALPLNRFCFRAKGFRVHQTDGPPFECVRRTSAIVVGFLSSVQVLGRTNIEAVICTS